MRRARKTKIAKLLNCYIVIWLFCFQYTILDIPVAHAGTADHLVISEVQIAGTKTTDDFIELYNPTNQEISLDGYRLVKRTKTGTTDTTLKSFSSADKIPIYGFYLWANSDFTTISSIPDVTTTGTVAADNGVALRNGAENTGEIIDSIGWGVAANVFVESLVFSTNPTVGKSIERKSGVIHNETKGNGEDTNNNLNDFVLRDISDPQNKSSAMEVPEGIIWPPPNSPPIAEAGDDKTIEKNHSLSFSASASSDSDGLILSYLWDFGDSASSSEENPSHTYSSSGTYTVGLTVTDDDGDTDSDSCIVTVTDPPVYSSKIYINEFLPAPGGSTDWDSSGTADSNDEWIELINLDDEIINLKGWILDDAENDGSEPYVIAVDTNIDPDGFKVFYKKDTGLVLNNTGGDSVVLKNPDNDVVDKYDFTATSTDKSYSRSNNSATSSWVTTYDPSLGEPNTAPGNNWPIANAGSNIVNAKTGEAVGFNGSGSADSDGSIVYYEWNFGDGATSSSIQASHIYTTPGTYQVSLTVRDNSGAASTDTISVGVIQNTGALPYQNQYSRQIKITEILPNATGADSDNEYIKLFNIGSVNVNLRNWILDDAEGGSKPFLIDYDTLIKPGSALNFCSSETKLSLNNSGDSARVFDPDKKLMDEVVYAESAPENTPYVLENGIWKWKVDQKNNKIINQENKDSNSTGSTNLNITANPLTSTTPNLSKIAVKENPAVVAAKTVANRELTALPIENNKILVNAGESVARTKAASSGLAQKDFTQNISSPVENSSPRPYQEPFAVVFGGLMIAGLIAKMLILPGDWRMIQQLSLNSSGEDLTKFENLFK